MPKSQLLRVLPALLLVSISLGQSAIANDALDVTNTSGNAVPGTDRGGANVSGRTPKEGLPPQALPNVAAVRKSRTIAVQLAKDEWLDRIAAAYPPIIEAICEHPKAAAIVAGHHRIAEIAAADHYLCRRLTRWHHATEVLLRNPMADKVIALDPQGMYWAIERRPAYGRLLAGHAEFATIINDDPNMGRLLSDHMR
jgi:hypothetical protein